MIDRTTLLFALPGFRVLNVTLDPEGGRLVRVESSAKEGGCWKPSPYGNPSPDETADPWRP